MNKKHKTAKTPLIIMVEVPFKTFFRTKSIRFLGNVLKKCIFNGLKIEQDDVQRKNYIKL